MRHRRTILTIASSLLLSLPALAGPTRLGDQETPVWVAASELLNDDGSFKDPWGLSQEIREQVLKQSTAFALRFGGPSRELEHGERPSRDLCVGVPRLDPDAPPIPPKIFYDPRIDHFDLTVLTSKVAVEATVSALVPGFLANGDPGLLLELSEVVPLHFRSALPSYTLVPTDQVVIHGRVFCADELQREFSYERPELGDRVVLIGPLLPQESVVRAWFYYEGRFAVVRGAKDGEPALDWATGYEEDAAWGITHTPVPSVPTDTLLGLYDHMDRLQESGLFEWVESLIPDPYVASELRDRFFKAWKTARDAGCRPRPTRADASAVWRLRLDCQVPVAEGKPPVAAILGEFFALRRREELP